MAAKKLDDTVDKRTLTSLNLTPEDQVRLDVIKKRLKEQVINPKKITNVCVFRALLMMGSDSSTDKLMKYVRQSFMEI